MTKKILTVDDDPTVTKLVGSILTANGYEVISASDGLEALAKIKKEQPDLVVLDVVMPEINGYDVCYQLRFNKDFEKVPIILLTSREQELDHTLAERSNIEYLQKPVHAKSFLQKVEQLLAKEKKGEKER